MDAERWMILWDFDNYKTVYGGNITENALNGVVSTSSGTNGCWYAIKVGSTNILPQNASQNLIHPAKRYINHKFWA